AEGNGEVKAKDAHRGPWDTQEEAQQANPRNEHLKLFTVADPQGTRSYTWARAFNDAIANGARARGRTATCAKAPGQAQLAAMLSALSPEDRAALLAQFQE